MIDNINAALPLLIGVGLILLVLTARDHET